MFRRTYRRLGHQFLQEPLGNEHGSLARGQRVKGMTQERLNQRLYLAGSGLVVFLYSTLWSGSFTRERVTAEGKYLNQ